MKEQIADIIKSSIDTKQQLLESDLLLQTINSCVHKIVMAFKNGNKVLFCGNGGSAADAQHLAAEFSGRFYIDRKALPAEALHCNTSYLTAVGNDYSYDVIYSRLIDGIGQHGDILIGITGGDLKSVSDYLINIPSADTPRIQEAHILVGHIICQLVEEKIFNTPNP